MDRLRPYFAELTRALLVLALVLLNLAHQPGPALAYDGFAYTSTASVYCGSGDPSDQNLHAPCHACRVGGDAVLPPPPCNAIAISLDMAAVVYSPASAPQQGDLHALAHRSRGPPLFA